METRVIKRKWWLLIAFLIIVGGILGFGNKGSYKFAKWVLQEELRKKDSIINENYLKIDSLVVHSENLVLEADIMREETDQFRTRNRNLIYALRKAQDRALSFRDTVFISNARYISESSHRYYKERDSIR